MGLVNPAYLVQGGDTLVDLRDRYAQNRYTSSTIANAFATLAGTVTANSNGILAHGLLTTSTVLDNVANAQGSGVSQTYGIPYRLTVMQVSAVQTNDCRIFIGIASATGNSWRPA